MNYEDETMRAECDRQIRLYKALTGGNNDWKKNMPRTECPLSVEDVGTWLREQMQSTGVILSDYARYIACEQGISYKRLKKARTAIGAEMYWWIDAETRTRYRFWELPINNGG